MFKNAKRVIKKMFREYLVYNHSSVEYRAKILTLLVSSDGEMCECEKEKLKEIAYSIYKNDHERAEILIDTVGEYHSKIITNNGLDLEHLITLVVRETKKVRRFADKIDMKLLAKLHECIDDEDNALYQERIMEFLQTLKDDYGKKAR